MNNELAALRSRVEEQDYFENLQQSEQAASRLEEALNEAAE